jgi:hypothetical protein
VQTVPVSVPKPADKDQVWAVALEPGAAAVTVGSDAVGLVDGTIGYNVAELKPVTTTGDRQVTIRSGNLGSKLVTGSPVKNDWALKLGRNVPIKLTVQAGATQGPYELGGLDLQSLVWNQGASAATVAFSQPNPDRLTTFDVTAGVSDLTMTGLANSNMGTATFKLGAGHFVLAFDGTLAQDATITVEGGTSALTIISGGNPVQMEADAGGLSHVTPGAWTQAGQTYSSPEWATATGPRIMIHTTTGAGGVTLRTRK